MGRIHVLTDQVANQIAAGEVVDRPASVVKELLENALDAGATRIRIEVEGGGRKLIRIVDNGCGMVRDDALLAFERHATSKLRTSDDLLAIATLGFRGEALPSIASIARVDLETRAAEESAGTRIEIAGGSMHRVEDAGLPPGTTIAVRDLFFNTPARRKFLKSETTELSHVTALVTHYALAHPDKHFELHSATHALLQAPPVAQPADRIFQIFGKETLDHLLPIAAEVDLERVGLPAPPPWKQDEDYEPPVPGHLRLSGFTSKPELEKLNRNSIYSFVNRRLVRDRLLLHAVSEAYRNILPPTSFPVVLLFLELPPEEVDVNVHPAKTEVRFRQPSFVHDFVRDTLRNKIVQSRPAMGFLAALETHAVASPSLLPGVSAIPGAPESAPFTASAESFALESLRVPPIAARLDFAGAANGAAVAQEEAAALAILNAELAPTETVAEATAPAAIGAENGDAATLHALASLKPIGQLRESFILATNEEGLWIIDQHVAHERVLFEKILREREVEGVERQRLLMPMLIDLTPAQMVAFTQIAAELERNGFEVEPFGPRTLAIKAAPANLEGRELERMLIEVLEQSDRLDQRENLATARARIAASIACHSAIKVNMPLDPERMTWLLRELGKTELPTSCPHGRPIALRYSWKDIERAFHRI
ncbi:MAG TPA: DNA mismatch repair endonuclease MutL [Acidobacteriaceae bacterium]|jgi:DNA mismatch repair protein MutL